MPNQNYTCFLYPKNMGKVGAIMIEGAPTPNQIAKCNPFQKFSHPPVTVYVSVTDNCIQLEGVIELLKAWYDKNPTLWRERTFGGAL